jgi:hypothetical protein
MKSIQRAHIVVVADSDHGLVLAARLRRMEVAQVTPVTGLDAARVICQAGDSDACIVVFDDTVPDAMPIAENDAPGRNTGVPSLMVVPTVTPYLRKMASRRGYMAAVSATIPPRMLYRRIGSALQRRCAARGGACPAASPRRSWGCRSLIRSANQPSTNRASQPAAALLAWLRKP